MAMISVAKDSTTYALNEKKLFSNILPDGITNNDYVFRENE